MTDLGRHNTHTAARHAKGVRTRLVPRRDRHSDVDRHGRVLGRSNPEGVAYEVCPMCSMRSMVRSEERGHKREWFCESCGYRDNESRALN